MPVTIHKPASIDAWLALRANNIGASEIGALIGVHDYITPFDLYAVHTGKLPRENQDSSVMRRGQLLEELGLKMLKIEAPLWTIVPNRMPGGLYISDSEARLGCTPDAFVHDPIRGGWGLVDVKSVAPQIFKERWYDGEELAAPDWVRAQLNIGADLANRTVSTDFPISWAAVLALRIHYKIEIDIIDVPLDAEFTAGLKRHAQEFWDKCARNEAPPIDLDEDAAIVRRLFKRDDGTHVDLSHDEMLVGLMAARATLKHDEKELTADLDRIDTAIRAAVGDAQTATIGEWIITLKSHNREGYTVQPGIVRQLRVHHRRRKDHE